MGQERDENSGSDCDEDVGDECAPLDAFYRFVSL